MNDMVVSSDYADAIRVHTLPSWLPINTACLVLIGNASAARLVLAQKTQSKLKKGYSYEVSKSLIGESILKLPYNDTWKLHRRVLESGMTHEVMKSSLSKVLESVDELVEKTRKSDILDISEEALKLTMDVIGKVALGIDLKSIQAIETDDAPLYQPFQEILHTLEGRVILPWLHWTRSLPTQANRRYDSAIAKLNSIVDSAVDSHLDERSERPADMLDVILENANLSDERNFDPKFQKLTRKEVVDDLNTMIFAGHDTTGAAGAWCLWLLSTQSEVHRIKIRAEACALGLHERNPTYEDLEKLDYLNAVVLETLRLFPSAGFTREATEDIQFPDGSVVPIGAEMFVIPWIIHHDPSNFENPDDFLPTRWMGKYVDVTSKSDDRTNSLQSRIGRIARSEAFLPFSLGARNCVGRPLALMELRVLVLKMIMEFDFEFRPSEKFQTKPLFTLTLNAPPIHLVPRKAAALV